MNPPNPRLIHQHCVSQERLALRAIDIIRSAIDGDLLSTSLRMNRSAARRLHESAIKLACAEESARLYAAAQRQIRRAPVTITAEQFTDQLASILEIIPENPTSPLDLALTTQRQNVFDDIAAMFTYVERIGSR